MPVLGGGIEASRHILSDAVSAPTVQPVTVGIAGRTNGSSSHYSTSFSDTFRPSAGFSAVVMFAPANTSQSTATIFGVGSTASNNQILHIMQDAGQLDFYMRDDSGSGYVKTAARSSLAANLVAGRMTCAAMRTHSTGTQWWFDGRQDTLRTDGGGTGDLTVNRIGVGAMVRASPALYWSGDVAFALMVDRVLPDAALQSLSINPWQVFRAEPVRMYSLPTSAIPSSLNVAASNVTSSGARATVTLVF